MEENVLLKSGSAWSEAPSILRSNVIYKDLEASTFSEFFFFFFLYKQKELNSHSQSREGGAQDYMQGGSRMTAGGFGIHADDDTPEDNFRGLPLIPSERDLTADEQLIVRRNRASGTFNNLEEYLDIQVKFLFSFILPMIFF